MCTQRKYHPTKLRQNRCFKASELLLGIDFNLEWMHFPVEQMELTHCMSAQVPHVANVQANSCLECGNSFDKTPSKNYPWIDFMMKLGKNQENQIVPKRVFFKIRGFISDIGNLIDFNCYFMNRWEDSPIWDARKGNGLGPPFGRFGCTVSVQIQSKQYISRSFFFAVVTLLLSKNMVFKLQSWFHRWLIECEQILSSCLLLLPSCSEAVGLHWGSSRKALDREDKPFIHKLLVKQQAPFCGEFLVCSSVSWSQ